MDRMRNAHTQDVTVAAVTALCRPVLPLTLHYCNASPQFEHLRGAHQTLLLFV
jgi:hypothetical protein